VESIVVALNAAKVRFLIVGGLAVAAHGYLRFTADVDLVLDPEPEALNGRSRRSPRSATARALRSPSKTSQTRRSGAPGLSRRE